MEGLREDVGVNEESRTSKMETGVNRLDIMLIHHGKTLASQDIAGSKRSVAMGGKEWQEL